MRKTIIPALMLALVVGLAQAAIAAGEFEAIRESADRVAASGTTLAMNVDALHELLNDGNRANDPFLISVCAPDDYAKAHIPGSINIPRGAFWKPGSLAKLPGKDRLIVTYCYTGTGAIGPATVLTMMGYKAVQLEWGTMGWSKNDAGLGTAPRFPVTQRDFPVQAGVGTAAGNYPLPNVETGKSNLGDILGARGDAVEAADKSVSMTADGVQRLMTDADAANDPFFVDIRDPADFAKGHIAGSINVPAATVYRSENLAKLPLARRIAVVDYNGQTAVGVSYVLSILGYNARGLQYGIMGWSKDDQLMGAYKRFPSDQRDFPVAAGQ